MAPAVGRNQEASHGAVRLHVVREKDTLWSIAIQAAGKGEDPRPLVDAMVHVNGVDPGRLVPGQMLRIPEA